MHDLYTKGLVERIDINVFEMKYQAPVNVKYSYVQLHNNYIIYSVDFTSDDLVITENGQRDFELPRERKRTVFEYIQSRNGVTGLDVDKNIFGNWFVTMMCAHRAEDIKFFFETKREAFLFRDKIFDWLTLNKKENEKTTNDFNDGDGGIGI